MGTRDTALRHPRSSVIDPPPRPLSSGRPAPGLRARPWPQGIALAGVLALAAGLRFAALGHNSVWFDEAYVAGLAQAGWQDIVATLRLSEPPLRLDSQWTAHHSRIHTNVGSHSHGCAHTP